jgi:hypothetical protein
LLTEKIALTHSLTVVSNCIPSPSYSAQGKKYTSLSPTVESIYLTYGKNTQMAGEPASSNK